MNKKISYKLQLRQSMIDKIELTCNTETVEPFLLASRLRSTVRFVKSRGGTSQSGRALAAIMTTIKFHIAFFVLTIFCITNTHGQKPDKFIGLTDSEIELYKSFANKNIDTVLFISFKSFAYNINNTNFRTMIVWQKEGKVSKKIMRDSILSEQLPVADTLLLDKFFEDEINSKQARKIKYNYWKKHRIGWINPLSNFHSINFFFKSKYYRETFLENSGVYGDEKMINLLTKELSWLSRLRTEMYD